MLVRLCLCNLVGDVLLVQACLQSSMPTCGDESLMSKHHNGTDITKITITTSAEPDVVGHCLVWWGTAR